MSLRTYEALYIIDPRVEEDVVQTVAKDIEQLVLDAGGAIVRSEIWGKRRLAYEVKKHMEGYYVFLRYEAPPEFNARIETFFRLSEHIIRHLVTLFDEQTLRLEAEQIRRRQEDIARGADRERERDDDEDRDMDRGRGGRREMAGAGRGRGRRRDMDEDEDDD